MNGKIPAIARDVFYNEALTPNQKLLYCALRLLADKNGTCRASFAELHRATGLAKSTVILMLGQFQNMGMLDCMKQKENRKGDTANIYQISARGCPAGGHGLDEFENTERPYPTDGHGYEDETLLNAVAASFIARFPNHPQISVITESMKRRFAERLREDPARLEASWWEGLFEKIEGSPWLTGNNPRGWKMPFDFLLKSSNLRKITEGRYKGRPERRTCLLGNLEDYVRWLMEEDS